MPIVYVKDSSIDSAKQAGLNTHSGATLCTDARDMPIVIHEDGSRENLRGAPTGVDHNSKTVRVSVGHGTIWYVADGTLFQKANIDKQVLVQYDPITRAYSTYTLEFTPTKELILKPLGSKCDYKHKAGDNCTHVSIKGEDGKDYYVQPRDNKAVVVAVNPYTNVVVCSNTSAYYTRAADGKSTYTLHIRDLTTGEEFTRVDDYTLNLKVYSNGDVHVGSELLVRKTEIHCAGCGKPREEVCVILPCECTKVCYKCASGEKICPNCKETVLKVIKP